MTKDEVLRLALEALEDYRSGCQTKYDADKAITSLRQAIAEAEAEKQEPVACVGTNGELMWVNKPKVIYSKPQPLYKSPPKREPLTDEEMQKIIKLVAEKCAEIADTAEPYQSADLIRKHFGVEK